MARAVTSVIIAGLDPSGGAGLLADVRAHHACGVWACGACALLTVQSTSGVTQVEAVRAELLAAQLEQLAADIRIASIKTGALGSSRNTRVVLAFSDRFPRVPLIVDPVDAPSRGGSMNLSGKGNVAAMRALAGAATIVTPNVPEAERMLDSPLDDSSVMDAAARALLETGARAVLLKGGHAATGQRVIDWLATARGCWRITRRRQTGEVHGTGCTYASLISARLAGMDARKISDGTLLDVVRSASRQLASARRRAKAIGRGMRVLEIAPRRDSRN